MKKIILILTLYCTFYIVNLNAQWFSQSYTPNNQTLLNVKFLNTSNGWIISYQGTIFKTTNGGDLWETQISGVGELYGLSCVDNNKVWAVGYNNNGVWSTGIIIRTTNGGTTWTQIDLKKNRWNSVFFFDANNGWVVGYERGYSKTTDGGTTWTLTSQSYPQGRWLQDVYFTDLANGWVVGRMYNGTNYYGTISRTTDGGTTWAEQFSGTTSWLYSVSFTDANNGSAVGERGTILRTTNGGATWTSQSSGLTILFSVSFTDANNGTAVGDYGTILRTTNGGVTFIEEEQIDEVPKEFLLSKNYPNPFNPNTKIKYALSSQQYAIIKIYDILGNEVETLVSEEKPAGTYEITWDGTNLSSGVYFYRLQAGSFIETKKMVLIK